MKKGNIIILIFFFIFTIYSLVNIRETNISTMNTLITFSKSILPALLPFLILNQLVIRLGLIDLLAYILQFISYPLFRISGKGASIIIIGLLNGFPSTAIFTSIMLKEKQLEKKEAQRLVNCIFFPSISFLFAIINSNLNSYLFTYLVLSIYLSGFILLYLSSFKIKKSTDEYYVSFKETLNNVKQKLNNFNFIKDIKGTISYAFNTLINILGIIITFSIPCNIIDSLIDNTSSYFFKGLIEFSMPSIQISSSLYNKKLAVSLLCPILSFSGFSSIIQANLFLTDCNLNTTKFFISRILISILSSFILSLFLFFLL